MSCDTSVHLTSLSLVGSGWSQKCPFAVNPGKMHFDLSFVFLDMIRDFSRGEGVLSLPEGMNVYVFVCLFPCVSPVVLQFKSDMSVTLGGSKILLV